MKHILSYLDYREYIRDYYMEKKKESRFSFREFAKAAGFSSPVFIKLVMEGKANLKKSSILKLCNAMGLKKDARRYFRNLVLFGQSKTIESKLQYLETMKSFQGSVTVDKLSGEQFEYFSKWYHAVIRELLDISEFDGDYQNLANMVDPPISATEARESVQLLEKLQLVKVENGRFAATHKFLTSEGLSGGSLAIRGVQKKMAQLAADALDATPMEIRDISGVSVSISPQSLDKIKEELLKCRRRIFEIASRDPVSDSVYRVNLHLFPISKTVPPSMLKNAGDRKYE
jgi:uncharacterized protein (TIGR02147 family)